MLAFRRLSALIAAVIFLAVFAVAMTSTLAVRAAGDEKFVPALLDDAGVYDFIYDGALDAALSDAVAREYVVSGAGATSPVTIRFKDPAKAKAALRSLVNGLVPREYVKQEVDQAFGQVVPYLTGRTDTFKIDLETGERIMAVPGALRAASTELSLGQFISEQVVAALVRQQVSQLTTDTLGITITEEEAVSAAAHIIPPEWVEQRLFEAADAVAPYLAGSADSFQVKFPLTDRVTAVADVLKAKLEREDLASKIIFDKIAGPYVEQALGGIKVLSFQVQVTPEEVGEALQELAPPEWMDQQAAGVIDNAVAYLIGETDHLEYTVDLSERKQAAIPVLQKLAERKLTEVARSIPGCVTAPDNVAALAELAASRIPKCSPFNLDLSAFVAPLLPLVLKDLDKVVLAAVPDSITYTDADLRSALGPGALATLASVRGTVQKGVSFTDQDLLGLIKDPEARTTYQDGVARVRAGVTWDQDDLTALAGTPEMQAQLDQVRNYGSYLRLAPWLTGLMLAVTAVSVGVTGGRGWPGRLKWTGAALATAAVVFLVAVQVGTTYAQDRLKQELSGRQLVDDQFRKDMPATAAFLESSAVTDQAAKAVGVLSGRYQQPARYWAVAGALVLALGVLLGVLSGRRRNGQTEEPGPDQVQPDDAHGRPGIAAITVRPWAGGPLAWASPRVPPSFPLTRESSNVWSCHRSPIVCILTKSTTVHCAPA